jgi:hypothetical protein
MWKFALSNSDARLINSNKNIEAETEILKLSVKPLIGI